jgi:hypothetical protein
MCSNCICLQVSIFSSCFMKVSAFVSLCISHLNCCLNCVGKKWVHFFKHSIFSFCFGWLGLRRYVWLIPLLRHGSTTKTAPNAPRHGKFTGENLQRVPWYEYKRNNKTLRVKERIRTPTTVHEVISFNLITNILGSSGKKNTVYKELPLPFRLPHPLLRRVLVKLCKTIILPYKIFPITNPT